MAYPATIDTMTAVNSAQTLAQAGHTARHNELATTVNAIQAELGTDPSGTGYSTVAARFTAITADVALKSLAANPVFTGIMSNPVGSAAAPSYTFTGSVTNGMYLATTNQIGITTAGVLRATIDATGLGLTGTIVASSTIAGSGLAGSLLSSATPAALGAAAAGTGTTPARQDHVHSNVSVSLTTPSLASPTITGTAVITGALDVQEIRELVVDGTITTNVLTLDYLAGTVMYVPTAPAANFTINVTNAPTDNGKAITVTVMVVQGATGYIPSALQIAGVAQTIKWPAAVTPTPTSSVGKVDVFSFTLIRRGSTWTVLGNSNLNY